MESNSNNIEEKSENFEYGRKTKAIKIINALQLIVCIFWGITNISNNAFISIVYWVSSIVIFSLIKGFSDIIDLLDNINYKIK